MNILVELTKITNFQKEVLFSKRMSCFQQSNQENSFSAKLSMVLDHNIERVEKSILFIFILSQNVGFSSSSARTPSN